MPFTRWRAVARAVLWRQLQTLLLLTLLLPTSRGHLHALKHLVERNNGRTSSTMKGRKIIRRPRMCPRKFLRKERRKHSFLSCPNICQVLRWSLFQQGYTWDRRKINGGLQETRVWLSLCSMRVPRPTDWSRKYMPCQVWTHSGQWDRYRCTKASVTTFGTVWNKFGHDATKC